MTLQQSALLAACLALTSLTTKAIADERDEAEVLALADTALELISAEDFPGLSKLMIEDAYTYRAAFRDGEYHVSARSNAEQRNAKPEEDIVERGFAATVLVSGPVAMVWYPYDLYLDGDWSHCGVDIFNLVKTNEGWRIASLSWSIEQPPACKPHPGGPPSSSD
jgi:hypothetical protein